MLLGHGENSIFDIQQELREQHPGLTVIPVIADVRDAARLHRVFAELKPFAVFHAAAHKHVPLMEVNLAEAVANNVIGTRNVVDAAAAADVAHLVLISTDKAVRPTSIMGATKRVAEQVVQLAASRHGRNFVSVRFGNVLGSRGSVVPTFLRQIRRGGPVTITHPDMRRYFMTIPEAVQLVLQAGALGSGGEVFVLDMGEPVRIVDLAEDLIRLSGLEVGTDVEVRFTGARPGEKLYEEMFFGAENVVPTEHPKVLRAKNAGLSLDVPKKLDRLVSAVERRDPEVSLRTALLALVPDFIEPGTSSTTCRPVVEEPQLVATSASAPASIERRGPALVPAARRRRAR
jgi:FlaA1/EpsC-like NDP-sugar epimerase